MVLNLFFISLALALSAQGSAATHVTQEDSFSPRKQNWCDSGLRPEPDWVHTVLSS